MKFTDPELEQRVQRMTAMNVGLPDGLRPVFALIDACDYFGHIEGRESPKVREAIELLLSQELRPALRSWYQRHGGSMNPSATEFRDRLAGLAGEKFG